MTRHKTEKQQPQYNQFQGYEIPCVKLNLTNASADYVTESINLESSGWTIEQALSGMAYLINEVRKLQKNK